MMKRRQQGRWNKGKLFALALSLLIGMPSAHGEEETGDSTWYDTTQGRISRSLDDSVTWFDDFFGDPRIQTDRKADASLVVTLDAFHSGVDGESEFNIRTRGYVSLPKFENKLRLTFSSDAETAITGEDAVDNEPAPRNTSASDGGLGLAYLFRDRENHTFSIGGGVKGGPDLYIKGEHQYTRKIDTKSRARLTNTLYWATDDGVGASSLLDIEHTRDLDTVWRYTLFGNISEVTNDLEWSTQGTWLHRLDAKTAISARIGVNGQTGVERDVDEYWTSFRYRRNIWRPWLYYELEPGLSWHHRSDYDVEPTMALRLEMQF